MATLHSQPHSPSRAEIRFADACRNLSDGWHVFFGVEWTSVGRGGEADHSGEMDAVLYHREYGLLVVEDLPFERFSPTTMSMLNVIADWTSRANQPALAQCKV